MSKIVLCVLFVLLFFPMMAGAGEHRQIRAEWEHSDPASNVAGFRIYYQGNIVCETHEPNARSLDDCEVLISGYPASFTATSYDKELRESAHSEPFVLSQSVNENVPPQAVLDAYPLEGAAPHQVAFDGSGSHDPDGVIVNYAWDFGSGHTDSGAQVAHTYTAAGEYTVTLTVTDDKMGTAQAETTVSVTASTAPIDNQPPVVGITASTLKGPAPLMVQLDGLESSDPDGELIEYLWEFGDGNSGKGEVINHIYTAPGTYTINLEVIDNHGASARDEIVVEVEKNTSTAAGFNFNFQPADLQAPEGYIKDSGSGFNEMSGFGWVVSPGEMGTRVRNSSHLPEDTFIHVDPSGTWELAVPNGVYLVTVGAGDSHDSETLQNIMVEGVPVIKNEWLSPSTPWLERDVIVEVQDGRLTLSFEGSSPHGKLAWLRVEHPSAWKPGLTFPKNGAANVRSPVEFNWSSPPASPHLALSSSMTYTLYYGTDPQLKAAAVTEAAGQFSNNALLAGGFLFGGVGLLGRRRSAHLFMVLVLVGGLPLLSSCGGDADSFPPLTGKVTDTRTIDNLKSTLFHTDDLEPGTTYYWKVVADNGRERTESEIYSFTTE